VGVIDGFTLYSFRNQVMTLQNVMLQAWYLRADHPLQKFVLQWAFQYVAIAEPDCDAHGMGR
jgi:hypothetical protein